MVQELANNWCRKHGKPGHLLSWCPLRWPWYVNHQAFTFAKCTVSKPCQQYYGFNNHPRKEWQTLCCCITQTFLFSSFKFQLILRMHHQQWLHQPLRELLLNDVWKSDLQCMSQYVSLCGSTFVWDGQKELKNKEELQAIRVFSTKQSTRWNEQWHPVFSYMPLFPCHQGH